MSGIVSLLDTNIVIGLLAGRQAALDALHRQNATVLQSAVSQITRIEVLGFPAITPALEARIIAFLGDVRVLLLDDAIERETIALRRRTRLKLPDAIIAATALVYGLDLVTLDGRLAAAMPPRSGAP